MIYDHLNSRFLSTEGFVNVIKQFIDSDPGRLLPKQGRNRIKSTRTKRNLLDVRSDPESLWESPWGCMLTNEQIKNLYSWVAKKFRRRFRIPYTLFMLVVEKCQSRIDPRFKILVALRILGRGNSVSLLPLPSLPLRLPTCLAPATPFSTSTSSCLSL